MAVTLAAAGVEFYRFYHPREIAGVSCLRHVYRGGADAEGFPRYLLERIPCPPYAATSIVFDPGPCVSDCESRYARLEPPERW